MKWLPVASGRASGRSRLHATALLLGCLLPSVPGCGDRQGPRAASARDSLAVRAEADSSVRALAAELLPEVETLSGLPARRPLSVAVRTREELEAFLTDQLAEQLPPEKLAAVQGAYARLGLVPEELDLGGLLRSLLLEQVVGYYDPARDTLYVMEGLDPALIEPVLAHEMVHALQDQYLDLDSLMAANRDANDRATAAQSALEGHATLAMLEWQLGRLTGGAMGLDAIPSLSSLPEDALMEAAGLEMPALASAPRLIRESLVFPYLGGLEFVRARWRASDGARFAPIGEEMPVSTEQVLHPDRAFGAARDDPAELVFLTAPPAGWRVVHADGLGELEIRVWLREHLGDAARAESAAAGWDGDRYRLTRGEGDEVLTWVTAWDSAAEAGEFAGAAREVAGKRYANGSGRVLEVQRHSASGVPLVVVVDRPLGVEPAWDSGSVAIRPASGR